MIEPLDATGTWALEIVIATVSKAPVFGEIRSASRSRLLVRVARDGDGWTQSQSLCTTTLEGGSRLARTVLPEAWWRLLPDRSYPLALTPDGGGWLYSADTGVQVIGYDPARGGLPARGADRQVVDFEGDGKPGATVLVDVAGFGTAEVFVATRGHTRLEGRFVRPDRVEGRVVLVVQEQATLGASHPIFDFTPDNRPDPTRSTFAMWRVSDGATCADQ